MTRTTPPVSREETLLRTLGAMVPDESRLRAAFARQPASFDLDTRIQAAWSEAIGLNTADVPSDRPIAADLPDHAVPLPSVSPTAVRVSGYTARDWLVGWATVAVALAVVILLASRCL